MSVLLPIQSARLLTHKYELLALYARIHEKQFVPGLPSVHVTVKSGKEAVVTQPENIPFTELIERACKPGIVAY